MSIVSERNMNEAISLAVTFIAIVVAYEFLKPKDDTESTNQQKDAIDEED
ncbi:hypothetical protein Sulku_2017 [Sulfuricurvum kujiense DSM 16994]|uniref:Uncharacterized protein n=1 Tax=Sulfuricurvum kujiense (strain ATCC BAA-921 / DSM 16994 / JCM 11577 / YK-1) TaxID=709032 RepID=E4U2J0_SULKY|nr:hypothetical protein Sulku_2017 [Sulfuricurvum kujiense DSM 16994]